MKTKFNVPVWHKILIICIFIWIIIFVTDMIRVKTDRGPIFCVPIARYKDGGSIDYVGVLYVVRKQVVDFDLAMASKKEGFKYIILPWFMIV